MQPKRNQSNARVLKNRAARRPDALATAAWPETTLEAVEQPKRLMGTDSKERKHFPITSGLLDYFPDACAGVSEISFVGNMKHNPGEPMHHSRGKSADHADCIARHLTERGGFDLVTIDGVEYRMRHSAALAWRAMALLQEELEAEGVCSLPRAAKLP